MSIQGGGDIMEYAIVDFITDGKCSNGNQLNCREEVMRKRLQQYAQACNALMDYIQLTLYYQS